MTWDGSPEHRAMLLAALSELNERGVGDEVLAKEIMHARSRLRERFPELTTTTVNRSTLYRWRTEDKALYNARHNTKTLVFNYLRYVARDPFSTSSMRLGRDISDHHLHFYLAEYFDVGSHKYDKTAQSLCGFYNIYHFSEVFAEKRAIVKGHMSIKRADQSGGALCVEEMQRYSGRLGARSMSEISVGYCIPKGESVSILLRSGGELKPKFYIFGQRRQGPDGKTEWMRGYLLRVPDSSGSLAHFYSPAYALRVSEKMPEVEYDIFDLSEIHSDVISELKKCQTLTYDCF